MCTERKATGKCVLECFLSATMAYEQIRTLSGDMPLARLRVLISHVYLCSTSIDQEPVINKLIVVCW